MRIWRVGIGHTEHMADDDPDAWREIADAVAASIRSGEYPPGTRIPSIRETADARSRARETVAKAYRHLVAEGLIVAEPKSGHRVTGVDGGSLAARVARLEQQVTAHDKALAQIKEALLPPGAEWRDA